MATGDLYKTILTLKVGANKVEIPVHKELFVAKSTIIAAHCELAVEYAKINNFIQAQLGGLKKAASDPTFSASDVSRQISR
jgi:hypothetical protein